MKNRSAAVKLGLLLTGLIITVLLVNMGQVILPFIFAGILAYFLQPFADMLLRRRIPLIWSVVCVYLLFALLLYLLLFLALPSLLRELAAAMEELPELMRRLQNASAQLPLFGEDFRLEDALRGLLPERGGGELARNLKNAAQLLFALLLAPMLSYYMLRDREALKNGLIRLLPPRHRAETCRIAADINRIFRSFFSGYVLLAIIVALLSLLLFTLLRVPYALLLALLLGVCDLIPYFGPFIGAVPAVALAFLQQPLKALWTALGIVLIQQLESSVLSPRILGSRIGLSPLGVIFSVLFGGYYLGFLGLVFAVPGAAALKLLVSYIYCRLSEAKA